MCTTVSRNLIVAVHPNLISVWPQVVYKHYVRACPKFSIAQRNWIGQLPPAQSKQHGLWDLGFTAADSLFGCMVSYSSSTSPTGGTRRTGHLYSTRPNTTLLRQRIVGRYRCVMLLLYLVWQRCCCPSLSFDRSVCRLYSHVPHVPTF